MLDQGWLESDVNGLEAKKKVVDNFFPSVGKKFTKIVKEGAYNVLIDEIIKEEKFDELKPPMNPKQFKESNFENPDIFNYPGHYLVIFYNHEKKPDYIILQRLIVYFIKNDFLSCYKRKS